MSRDIKAQIKQLNKELLADQSAYYDGKPVISDAEYDAKEARLVAMITNNPQYSPIATSLKKVGTAKMVGKRILHDRPMLSIENNYTEDDFVAAAKNYGAILLEEPKRDGISCELRYDSKGILTLALTRGDGEAGEEMTEQVKACKKIPNKISNPYGSELRLRGELVMCKSEFARINNLLIANGENPHSNPRNLVSGTMKTLDLSIVSNREILCMPWDMYSPDHDEKLPDSAYDRMQLAHKFGFPEYEGERVNRNNKTDIVNTLHIILKKNENSDIIADGVVLKVDSHKLRNKLGVASKFTKYQHCFKPQNQKGITYLRKVEWGVGRTGKIAPIGIVDPIQLGGATITRVTLNNETWIKNLKLKINSKIEIIRSGDCIPLITAVLDV